MRRVVLVALVLGAALLPSVATAQPFAAIRGRAVWRTVWSSPLDKNGPPSSTSLPTSFPTPTIIWWGPSPLTNYGSDGGTFTASGATTAANSPFCPSGNFTDLTNTTNCLEAREFDGADYYELSGTGGDINSTHLSACAVFRSDNAGAVQEVAGKRDDGDDEGWSLGVVGTPPATGQIYIETDAANISRTVAGASTGYWTILCGTAAAAGNAYAYNNGTASAATAYPAGTATTATHFRVGTSSAGATLFDGAVLAVYVWPGTTLSSTQVKQFTQYWMGVLPQGDYTSDWAVTSGRECQWMGQTTQKLVCFGDDLLMIGGVIAPGLTGAGNGGGFYLGDQATNVLLQSRDPSATWAVTGTLLGATSTADSPFLDSASFPVTLLEDDDALAAEYMAQGMDMTALSAGNRILLNFYVRSGTGTKGFDFRVYEDVGGGCTTSQTDYDAVEVTTSWKSLTYTYSVLDGDCTSFILYVGGVSGAHPADFADATQTGDIYMIGQVFMSTGYTATTQSFPIYIETTTASASGGMQKLAWINNANAAVLQDAATDTSRMEITVTPSYAFNNLWLAYVPIIHSGAYGNYHRCVLAASAGSPYTCRTATVTPWLSVAAPGWAAGTSTTFAVNMAWAADAYEVFQDGVSKDTDATVMAPEAGIDSIDLGYASGTSNQGYGMWIKNFKYKRR